MAKQQRERVVYLSHSMSVIPYDEPVDKTKRRPVVEFTKRADAQVETPFGCRAIYVLDLEELRKHPDPRMPADLKEREKFFVDKYDKIRKAIEMSSSYRSFSTIRSETALREAAWRRDCEDLRRRDAAVRQYAGLTGGEREKVEKELDKEHVMTGEIEAMNETMLRAKTEAVDEAVRAEA